MDMKKLVELKNGNHIYIDEDSGIFHTARIVEEIERKTLFSGLKVYGKPNTSVDKENRNVFVFQIDKPYSKDGNLGCSYADGSIVLSPEYSSISKYDYIKCGDKYFRNIICAKKHNYIIASFLGF